MLEDDQSRPEADDRCRQHFGGHERQQRHVLIEHDLPRAFFLEGLAAFFHLGGDPLLLAGPADQADGRDKLAGAARHVFAAFTDSPVLPADANKERFSNHVEHGQDQQ